MKKKLLALALPIGLLIELVYSIVKRFIEIPNIIAYPILIIGIGLLIVGIAYNGCCLGKRKNPHNSK